MNLSPKDIGETLQTLINISALTDWQGSFAFSMYYKYTCSCSYLNRKKCKSTLLKH